MCALSHGGLMTWKSFSAALISTFLACKSVCNNIMQCCFEQQVTSCGQSAYYMATIFRTLVEIYPHRVTVRSKQDNGQKHSAHSRFSILSKFPPPFSSNSLVSVGSILWPPHGCLCAAVQSRFHLRLPPYRSPLNSLILLRVGQDHGSNSRKSSATKGSTVDVGLLR